MVMNSKIIAVAMVTFGGLRAASGLHFANETTERPADGAAPTRGNGDGNPEESGDRGLMALWNEFY